MDNRVRNKEKKDLESILFVLYELHEQFLQDGEVNRAMEHRKLIDDFRKQYKELTKRDYIHPHHDN